MEKQLTVEITDKGKGLAIHKGSNEVTCPRCHDFVPKNKVNKHQTHTGRRCQK